MNALYQAKAVINLLDKATPENFDQRPGLDSDVTHTKRVINWQATTPQDKAAVYLLDAAVKKIDPNVSVSASDSNGTVTLLSEFKIGSSDFSAHQVRAALKSVEKELGEGWEKQRNGDFSNPTLAAKNINPELFDVLLSGKALRVHDITKTGLTEHYGQFMNANDVRDIREMPGDTRRKWDNLPVAGVQLTAQEVSQVATDIGFKNPARAK